MDIVVRHVESHQDQELVQNITNTFTLTTKHHSPAQSVSRSHSHASPVRSQQTEDNLKVN